MKKILSIIFTAILIAQTFVVTFAGEKAEIGVVDKEGFTVLKIGTTGTDLGVWETVNKNLEKDKIKLELVTFEDYILPNQALVEGDIDLNAFQHQIFFDNFVKEYKLEDKLSVLNYTVIAPLAFYSEKHQSIEDLPDGAKIAIPNDATNGGRALRILQANGLIKVDDSKGLKPTIADITENPHKYEIIEVQAQQTPRLLSEVDLAAVNSGYADKANLDPKTALIREDIQGDEAKNYWNLVAIRTEDKDKKTIQKVKNAYLKQNVFDELKKAQGDGSLPVFEVTED